MAFLAINGYELPPCKRGVGINVTTVVNAGRNANGVVIGQKIGRDQYKIDALEWPWLSSGEWSKILSLFKDFFVRVTFNDPVTNSVVNIKMYPSDRRAEPYFVDGNGTPIYYTNCRVHLIDTGE